MSLLVTWRPDGEVNGWRVCLSSWCGRLQKSIVAKRSACSYFNIAPPTPFLCWILKLQNRAKLEAKRNFRSFVDSRVKTMKPKEIKLMNASKITTYGKYIPFVPTSIGYSLPLSPLNAGQGCWCLLQPEMRVNKRDFQEKQKPTFGTQCFGCFPFSDILSGWLAQRTIKATMSADLFSLPFAILTEIWDYCEAQDIMALRATSVRFRSLMDETMLVVDGECGSGRRPRRIPVFDTEHCHSVFLIAKLRHEQDRLFRSIVLESRPKHSKGRFTTVVWKKTVFAAQIREMIFHIGFRNDPSQEYQIRHDCPWYCNDGPIFTVRKQFMRRPFTPTRTRAITACFAMVNTRAFQLKAFNISGLHMLPLFWDYLCSAMSLRRR